jgi:hypothetical protein
MTNISSLYAGLPEPLQATAIALHQHLVGKTETENAAGIVAKITALSSRGWLIEQHNKLAMGRSLDDNAPLDVMLHDAAAQLIADEFLTREATARAARLKRRQTRTC